MERKGLLKIEKESRERRETIALLPFESGVYPTEKGEVEMRIFPKDSQGQQKVVFMGDFIPTIKQRGKRGQFRDDCGKRRVVDFSPRPKSISQDIGVDSRLVFRRENTMENESFAAD